MTPRGEIDEQVTSMQSVSRASSLIALFKLHDQPNCEEARVFAQLGPLIQHLTRETLEVQTTSACR